MSASKNITIIIPVYNECLHIRATMENLKKFEKECQIIFVDGGSKDGTDQIIKEEYELIYAPQKGRSSQMNYGAEMAKGSILLFLHADSQLPPDGLDKILEVMEKGYKVGCFKLKFDSNKVLMKICGFMSNMRVVFRNIAFGDQGIFIEKNYFNQLGKFPLLPLMEDYQLSINIKNSGEKIRLINAKITTSQRRFTENGIIKTMINMQRLQYMFRKGIDIHKIVDLYK